MTLPTTTPITNSIQKTHSDTCDTHEHFHHDAVLTQNHDTHPLYQTVIDSLMTVYDPEVPLIDIYTLGLIYGIAFDDEAMQITIFMTFTTPACPMGDLLKSMTTDAVLLACPDYLPEIVITFDPMRTSSMIKDEDLQRMFL